MTEAMSEDPLLADFNQCKRQKCDDGHRSDGDNANSPPKKKAKMLDLVRMKLLTWQPEGRTA